MGAEVGKTKKQLRVLSGSTNFVSVVQSENLVASVTLNGVDASFSEEPQGGSRAYVNLPRQDATPPHVFELHVELSGAPPGGKLYYLLQQEGDRPTNPLTGADFALPARNQASLGATAADAARAVSTTFTGEVTDRVGMRIGLAYLRLSTFGGARVRVGVTSSAKAWRTRSEDEMVWTDWLTTWRKVYYQVDGMLKRGSSAESHLDVFDLVKQPWLEQFAKAYVELEQTVAPQTVPFKEYLTTEYATVAGYGRAARLLKAARGTGDFRSPQIHVVMVDTLRTRHDNSKAQVPKPLEDFTDQELLDLDAFLAGADQTFVLDSAPADWTADISETLRSDYDVEFGALSVSVGNEAAVTVPNAKVFLEGDQYRVRADLSAFEDRLARGPLKVKLEYTWWDVGSAAAADVTCLIGSYWRFRRLQDEATRVRSCLKSLAHEVGHLFGLAGMNLPDFAGTSIDDGVGLAKGTAARPSHHHGGAHCKRNLSLDAKTACTMFHNTVLFKDGPTPTHELCEVCLLILRGRVLTKLPYVYDSRTPRNNPDFQKRGYDPKR